MSASLLQSSSIHAASSSRILGGKLGFSSTSVSRVVPKAGNWLPGSTPPAYLPKDLPGNFGYDPLRLGTEPAVLKRYQEGEIINGRWAMLGVAGMLFADVLGYGDWVEAPKWALTGGKATYFGIEIPFDLKTLAIIEIFAMAGVEAKRNDEKDPEKRMYPGGAFDPFGFSKNPASFADFKVKEIKNGRLAMFAFVGFVAQYSATGKGPVTNLLDHLANPWGANFATNGVSLPGF